MSEHHCVHETDTTSQPRRSKVRTGIQYVHRKEDEAEVMFANPEATEEPISDQGIGQEASAKSIQGKIEP